MHPKQKLNSSLTVFLGATTISFSVVAAEFNYGIGYTSEYTTNATAVPRDRRDEWINAVTGRIAYADNSETLVARLTSEVQYRDYAHDISTDETVYAIDASAVWTIFPRQFTWTFEDFARQVQLNPIGPVTPANRAAANVFRTGPDFFFRVGGGNTLALGARYSNLYVGSSDVDNEAYTGAVRWLYQQNPHTTWSLNVQRQEVEFKNPLLNENFSRNDAYLQLDKRFSQSQLVLLGGATRVQPERSAELSGSLGRMSWTYSITSESTFGLAAGVGYQDTGFELLGTVSAPTAPLTPIAAAPVSTDAVSGDVYYNRFADIFYTLRDSRMEYRLRASGRELDFRTTLQDREEAGGRFEANYLYSVTSTIGIFGDYLKVKYLDIFRTDRDKEIGMRYGYRMTRTLTLGLEAKRHERQSTDPNAEYVDNRYLLSIVYSTEPLRLAPTQP